MFRAHAFFAEPRRVIPLAACLAGLLTLAACDMDSGNSDDSDPTTRALADPMNAAPNFDNDTVTGGGTANFDSKAFNKDVNHVLNPP
ncbi:MAG: hypothetical protein ABSF29_03130 [Tepidisphaeraceae bacterium]|jgi:hypothetical protein